MGGLAVLLRGVSISTSVANDIAHFLAQRHLDDLRMNVIIVAHFLLDVRGLYPHQGETLHSGVPSSIMFNPRSPRLPRHMNEDDLHQNECHAIALVESMFMQQEDHPEGSDAVNRVDSRGDTEAQNGRCFRPSTSGLSQYETP